MDIETAIDFHNKGNFEKALNGYLENLEKNPNDAFLNDALARLYNQTGKFKEAENHAKIATNVENKPDYMENLATSYCLQNKLNEAMILFEKILEKTPKDIERIRDYASIAYDFKQWEYAIKFYSKSILIDKNDCIALNNIGTALEAQKKFDEAKKYYEL